MQAEAQITIHGNLTKDPEKLTLGGKDAVKFSVAVNGRKDDPPTYYEVTSFRKVPDFIQKGSPVCVIGSFRPRTYAKKDGGTGTSYDVTLNELIALPSPKREAQAKAGGGGEEAPF